MRSRKVYILGGAQTDFAQKWSSDENDIGDIMAASFAKAIQSIDISPKDIDALHIGNFVGELFCGQGQLGGVFVQHFPELVGMPSMRYEAACASGSMAALGGMKDIISGHADLVAVCGVEWMRLVNGQIASEYLGAAAWQGHEAQDAQYPWVHLFSKIKEYYQEQYDLDDQHLAAIAKYNYQNATKNTNAQTRKWILGEEDFGSNPELNPIIEGTLRKSDCARITDGSATIFLASEAFTKKFAASRGIPLNSIPYIKGWGHQTAPIALAYKLDRASQNDYAFPHLRNTINQALQRAAIENANGLDGIETHDCFTISEYLAIEHFGLSAPGEGWKRIEDESITMTGALPINASGGLIGLGHPVGATGVRMLLDAYKQVAGMAGDYQIENAQNIATLNIGGSFTTVASFVVGRS